MQSDRLWYGEGCAPRGYLSEEVEGKKSSVNVSTGIQYTVSRFSFLYSSSSILHMQDKSSQQYVEDLYKTRLLFQMF